ncbi:MAG: type II toxin-antitoxin system RelE/ParE family toxin [Oscillospiraceae bacterium]|nr:type II toxin-antitoxin system RelE/ParE family toxin [Oscillospiraceae bacterium]
MAKFNVVFSDRALRSLKKIDKYHAKIIIGWIEKNLIECENPRLHGKALTGDKKDYWRYRVGTYRIIADIQDKQINIHIINIAHRREIYN